MRIAIVSPYSWTYPGGVARHIEGLALELLAGGHDVRVLAPYDPPDALSARLHRGARPTGRDIPEWLVPLGRTVGFAANGAVSNLAIAPATVSALRTELRSGGYDVVHLHEPIAPVIAWDALCSTDLPLVGTFHCYSTNQVTNNAASLIGARRRLNRLHVRIAVSEAAAWTARSFYGGRYRIIPNGVHLPAAPTDTPAQVREPGAPLRIVFVGQAVERKGLPVLLRAFEALRDHVPATLTIIGAEADAVSGLLLDDHGVRVLGKVDDATKVRAVQEADVLCAPSLGGESFGMVLTEAFAAGTAVVASDIAGYRDVVRDGVDGLLVAPGDPVALAQTLRDLALGHPGELDRMAAAARDHAQRYAWPRIAAQVLDAYEDAVAVPAPRGATQRLAVRVGALPADLQPRVPAQRLPTMERPPADRRGGARRHARTAGLAVAAAAGVGAAGLALQQVGVGRVTDALLTSSPTWVLVGLSLMCLSMVLRACAWHQILVAALPDRLVRPLDAMQGTFIGVLMSATLPARLGEPSRALIVARRVGHPRDTVPVVLGTIVSQTLLNILALVILGAASFSTMDSLQGDHGALLAFAIAPLVILAGVLATPVLLRRGVAERQGRVAIASARVQAMVQRAGAALTQVRDGLAVFRDWRLGTCAVVAQLAAWGLQWMSCYALLVALGLDDRAGLGAAAAVLFAVNVTAVLPATPSNVGVFQAAAVAVLGAYGVGAADALGYGIVLQAVEIATAVAMGAPALLKEGLSWRDVRTRALHAAPIQLAPLPHQQDARAAAASAA
jgi:phosphatidylinositol alpha-mannosyltransferase